jgi:hypothetical protein
MSLWLRAGVGEYVIAGGRTLYPGQALAFDPASAVHAAIAGEIAAGITDLLELIEAASDPSGPPPPDPPDLAAKRARAAARSHEARLQADNPMHDYVRHTEEGEHVHHAPDPMP